MNAPIIGALLSCMAGALLALGNDKLTRAVMRKRPSLVATFSAVRQLINVTYLAALYLLAPALPWDELPLLIGGALGVTVPSILLAVRLARQVAEKPPEGEATKAAATDGTDMIVDGKERD